MKNNILKIFILFTFIIPSAVLARENEILIKKTDGQILVENVGGDKDIDEAISEWSARTGVEYAEKMQYYKQSAIISDPYYDAQWYLRKIKADSAWSLARDAQNVVIAVLDSGVQITHPDLAENIWRNVDEAAGNNIDDDKNGFVDDVHGWDFTISMPNPIPNTSGDFNESGLTHGTIIAGLVGAATNNATGVASVAWNPKIMPLKVLDDKGEGDSAKVVKAIDYAIKNGADVINLSFVGFGYSRAIEEAIGRAHRAGIIIVAAAGNENDNGDGYFLDETPMYPACHDGPQGENWVIGVAATDGLDQKASFSSYGFKCVDISAPGVSIFGTTYYNPNLMINDQYLNKQYNGYWSGTSMAVPLVSSAAALISTTNPLFSKNQVVSALLDNADNINLINQNYSGRLGRGRLNVDASVKEALSLKNQNEDLVLAYTQKDTGSFISKLDSHGNMLNSWQFNQDGATASVAICDIDKNNVGSEIIVGTGPSNDPMVKVFSAEGKEIFSFFAYDKNFRGGVNVACADLNNDGFLEIVVGAGNGGGPHIRIFDNTGRLRGQFFAYDKNFRGGVNVAVGDVNGDGSAEIIAGAGNGGGPHVRIFNDKGVLLNHFFAYDKNFRGGVKIALSRSEQGTRGAVKEIVATRQNGETAEVSFFNFYGVKMSSFSFKNTDSVIQSLSMGDINKDGVDEVIITTDGVKIFEKTGRLINTFKLGDAVLEVTNNE